MVVMRSVRGSSRENEARDLSLYSFSPDLPSPDILPTSRSPCAAPVFILVVTYRPRLRDVTVAAAAAAASALFHNEPAAVCCYPEEADPPPRRARQAPSGDVYVNQ